MWNGEQTAMKPMMQRFFEKDPVDILKRTKLKSRQERELTKHVLIDKDEANRRLDKLDDEYRYDEADELMRLWKESEYGNEIQYPRTDSRSGNRTPEDYWEYPEHAKLPKIDPDDVPIPNREIRDATDIRRRARRDARGLGEADKIGYWDMSKKGRW